MASSQTLKHCMDVKTRTDKATVEDAPRVLGVLLLRFERDFNSLMDCASVEERERFMRQVRDMIRVRLMINDRWSHEASTRMAEEYRSALKYRLARPEFFRKRTGDV